MRFLTEFGQGGDEQFVFEAAGGVDVWVVGIHDDVGFGGLLETGTGDGFVKCGHDRRIRPFQKTVPITRQETTGLDGPAALGSQEPRCAHLLKLMLELAECLAVQEAVEVAGAACGKADGVEKVVGRKGGQVEATTACMVLTYPTPCHPDHDGRPLFGEAVQ